MDLLTRLVKIVKASLSMTVDEEFKDMSIDEMAEGESDYINPGVSEQDGAYFCRATRELAALRAHLPRTGE